MKIDDLYWSKHQIDKNASKFGHLREIIPGDVKTIADVGGGSGDMYYMFKNLDIEYLLIDHSDSALQIAQSNDIKFIKHNIDGGKLPIEDNSFDLVFLNDVLEHLRNPWAALAESVRISKKYIIIYGPNFASLRSRIQLLLGRPIGHMSIDKYGAVTDSKGNHISHIYFLTYNNILHWSKVLNLNILIKQAFWSKRFFLFRWLIDPLFNNLGENYRILLEKPNNFIIPQDNNFNFYE